MEDEELQANQMTEAMPTSLAGFKDHPLYVLARHLKREEVVDPPVELGKFRGEPVYSRANVLQLKTAENWIRQGRRVVVGAHPLKWVKQRAVTVNRKRAIEMVLADRRERTASASGSAHVFAAASVNGRGADDEEESGDTGLHESDGLAVAGEGFAAEDGVMQGLYAEHQTEIYKPPPVVDVSRSCSCHSLRNVQMKYATAGQSAKERFRQYRLIRSVNAARRCRTHPLFVLRASEACRTLLTFDFTSL